MLQFWYDWDGIVTKHFKVAFLYFIRILGEIDFKIVMFIEMCCSGRWIFWLLGTIFPDTGPTIRIDYEFHWKEEIINMNNRFWNNYHFHEHPLIYISYYIINISILCILLVVVAVRNARCKQIYKAYSCISIFARLIDFAE